MGAAGSLDTEIMWLLMMRPCGSLATGTLMRGTVGSVVRGRVESLANINDRSSPNWGVTAVSDMVSTEASVEPELHSFVIEVRLLYDGGG